MYRWLWVLFDGCGGVVLFDDGVKIKQRRAKPAFVFYVFSIANHVEIADL